MTQNWCSLWSALVQGSALILSAAAIAVGSGAIPHGRAPQRAVERHFPEASRSSPGVELTRYPQSPKSMFLLQPEDTRILFREVWAYEGPSS